MNVIYRPRPVSIGKKLCPRFKFPPAPGTNQIAGFTKFRPGVRGLIKNEGLLPYGNLFAYLLYIMAQTELAGPSVKGW